MPSPSNIYAEKAYSEHPIAMWALDDQLDYVSYLQDSARDIASEWAAETNQNISDDVTVSEESINLGQYLDGGLFKIVSEKRSGSDLIGKSTIISPTVFNFEDLDADLATFSIGTYFYSDTEYVNGITIGYTYREEITDQLVRVSKKFETSVYKNWIYISETFDIPNFTSDVNLFIDIEYYDSQDPETEYVFYLNGLSLGQWSEEFQSESLGMIYKEDGTGSIIDFPTSIDVGGADKAVIARAYGLQNDDGYYLATPTRLFAQNKGMPLVFGASGATTLLYNDGLPSLIVPSRGMLSNAGKHSTYTLEAWMRIDSSSIEPHRIFGPVSSEDGVYVDHERFYLKISDSVASAVNVEWGRPMLIHLKYSKDKVVLAVNTEEIINIPLDANNIYLPDSTSVLGKSQDWIGFYAAEDVSIDVDCIGIYPYLVDKTLAKRRWVYGQNVEYPENLNSAYDGKTVAISYPSANYAANFVFPKNAAWSGGIYENITFEDNQIKAPVHPLPNIVLSSGDSDSWISDQTLNNNYEYETYIKMKPGSEWEDIGGYLYLENIGFMSNDIQSVYGIFKSLDSYEDDQILIKIRDRSSGKHFSIVANEESVLYKFYNGTSEETLKTVPVSRVGEMFVAGIKMDSVSSYYGQQLVEFFSNRTNFEVYICGDDTFQKTYLGNIYNFSIATTRNSNIVGYMFGSDGIVMDKDSFYDIMYDAGHTYFGNDPDYWAAILDGGDPYSVVSDKFFVHVASYKLAPIRFFGEVVLDISTHSTWEDYVPLSYFAKYVKDSDSGSYYDLDFIQFNVGYPTPNKLILQKAEPDVWTYGELQAEYISPVEYTYAELDNELFSGYASYQDLKDRTKSQYVYDTEDYSVKTYITFQYVDSGANNLIESYSNTENVSTNNLIKAGDEWVNTKYEVIDGTVIYPPRSIKFSELAIVTHVEIVAKSVISKPVSVASIELTSQALDSKTPTPVGTKFAIPLFPYTKSGVYFNYKAINPFKIYKKSAPYLYLSKNSGIELVGDTEPLVNRGVTVPLNSSLASRFDVAALQILMKYNKEFFPYSSTPIFEIQARDTYIKFYLVANHPNGKRAKIYAINANTGLEENGVAFYINGRLVKNPNISVQEWSMLGISFAAKLNLNNFAGAFRLNGPIVMNHMSYYQSTGLQEKIFTTFRVWDRVRETLTNQELAWDFWKGTGSIIGTYSWNNVLVIGQTSSLGISLPEIFKSYIGTNKIIFDDNSGVSLSGYRFRTYRRVSPVSFTKKPS
jgi:hypothetical protein